MKDVQDDVCMVLLTSQHPSCWSLSLPLLPLKTWTAYVGSLRGKGLMAAPKPKEASANGWQKTTASSIAEFLFCQQNQSLFQLSLS